MYYILKDIRLKHPFVFIKISLKTANYSQRRREHKDNPIEENDNDRSSTSRANRVVPNTQKIKALICTHPPNPHLFPKRQSLKNTENPLQSVFYVPSLGRHRPHRRHRTHPRTRHPRPTKAPFTPRRPTPVRRHTADPSHDRRRTPPRHRRPTLPIRAAIPDLAAGLALLDMQQRLLEGGIQVLVIRHVEVDPEGVYGEATVVEVLEAAEDVLAGGGLGVDVGGGREVGEEVGEGGVCELLAEAGEVVEDEDEGGAGEEAVVEGGFEGGEVAEELGFVGLAVEGVVVGGDVDGVDDGGGVFELVHPALADVAVDVEEVHVELVPLEPEFFGVGLAHVGADDVGFGGNVVFCGYARELLGKVGCVLGKVDFEVFDVEVGEDGARPEVLGGLDRSWRDGCRVEAFDFVEEDGEVLIECGGKADAGVFEEVDDGLHEEADGVSDGGGQELALIFWKAPRIENLHLAH